MAAWTQHLRLSATFYELGRPRRPGAIGRPRSKGRRLPNLSEVLADRATPWWRVTVPSWYSEGVCLLAYMVPDCLQPGCLAPRVEARQAMGGEPIIDCFDKQVLYVPVLPDRFHVELLDRLGL